MYELLAKPSCLPTLECLELVQEDTQVYGGNVMQENRFYNRPKQVLHVAAS